MAVEQRLHRPAQDVAVDRPGASRRGRRRLRQVGVVALLQLRVEEEPFLQRRDRQDVGQPAELGLEVVEVGLGERGPAGSPTGSPRPAPGVVPCAASARNASAYRPARASTSDPVEHAGGPCPADLELRAVGAVDGFGVDLEDVADGMVSLPAVMPASSPAGSQAAGSPLSSSAAAGVVEADLGPGRSAA